jgi:hypothetical protein
MAHGSPHMKKALLFAIFLAVNLSVPAKDKHSKNPLMASGTVIWAGLDYSMVRMIDGNKSEFGFNVPDAIFPGMLDKWNQLFIDERVERVAKALGKRVSLDIGGVTERNKTATSEQIVLAPGPNDGIADSHITQRDIAVAVQSYKLAEKSGLCLVFIVDRLVNGARHLRPSGGAVYVVFFDVATREVISATREFHFVSSGGNFRNFWFGPIKETDKKLSKYR